MITFYFLFSLAWASAWTLTTPIQGPTASVAGWTLLAVSAIIGIIVEARREDGVGLRWRLGRELFLAVAPIVIQLLIIIPLYLSLAAAVSGTAPLGSLVRAVIDPFAAASPVYDGVFYIQTNERVLALGCGLEKIDGYFLVSFSFCLLWTCSIRLGLPGFLRAVVILLLVMAYAVVRTSVLLLVYADVPGVPASPMALMIFQSPWMRIIGYAPVALFAILIPRSWAAVSRKQLPVAWPVACVGTTATVVACLMLALAWNPVAVHRRTEVRVLMDDFHSGMWEKSHVPFDEAAFGGENLYNYYTMRTWLERDFHVTINKDRRFDEIDLSKFEVVIVKTPNVKFTERETEALRAFIASGGGCAFIGDHTDLLGMSSNMNAVLQPYGVAFRADSCNQLSTGFISAYEPWRGISTPLLHGLERIEFLTSCSIASDSIAGSCIIPGYDLFSDRRDYAMRNFFGDMIVDGSERFGVLSQCHAQEVGNGRFVMWSDSTVFSNFCFFQGGHDRFITNMVDYLSRGRSPFWAYRVPLVVMSVVLLCIAAWCILRQPAWLQGLLVMGAVIFWSGGMMVASAVAGIGDGTIASRPRDIAFVREGCIANYPPIIGIEDHFPRTSYNSLYCSPQRFGMSTTLAPTWDEAISGGSGCIVLIDPVPEVWNERRARLDAWVRKGGELIVFLGDSGVGFGTELTGVGTPVGEELRELGSLGRVRLTCYTVGSGRILAFDRAATFSDGVLGHPMAKPDQSQLVLYELLKSAWRFGKPIKEYASP